MNEESPDNMSENEGVATSKNEKKLLPFNGWLSVLAGAIVGVLLRLVFIGSGTNPYTAMMGSFIYLSPILVGAVTVYIAERQARRTWSYYFLAPFIANILFVCGTLLIMIEGIICAILIVPLFGVLGGVSGLMMGAICRLTNWPKQAVYSVAVLPLLLGGFEQHLSLPTTISTVERFVVIDATPENIWRHLENTDRIQPSEVESAWLYRIGVPMPQAGLTEHLGEGATRHVTMGKGIHFDQVAIAWEPNRRVKWRYRFAADSFPPHALDDHVRIGGEYFDLLDTEYSLTPQDGKTELRVRMSYRVSTRFNWYARPIAELLIGNFEEVILNFYAQRAQAR